MSVAVDLNGNDDANATIYCTWQLSAWWFCLSQKCYRC